MFFLKLLVTGIVAGIIGFLVLERWLKTYLIKLPLRKQIFAILILGLLYTIVFVTSFAGLISDLTQTRFLYVWLVLFLGVFSTNTIIILIVVLFVIMTGGYKEFVKIAEEVLTPFVAGIIGFLFGLIQHKENYSLYLDPGVIASINFMAGFFGGFVSAFIAFLTKRILSKFLSSG